MCIGKCGSGDVDMRKFPVSLSGTCQRCVLGHGRVANQRTPFVIEHYLTIRPVARKGYGSIAHEAKLNGLLTRRP